MPEAAAAAARVLDPILAALGGMGISGDDAIDATVDALLVQAGVIKVSTIGQLFDVARLLLSQPIPAGPRVAILSNSAGPARLAIDACRGAVKVGEN